MAEENIKESTRAASASSKFAKSKRKGQPAVAMSSENSKKQPPSHRDVIREILETVVFVVILVLLLKTFIAEAFVIPTGSMANTLYGHHEKVDCPQCGFPFPVNTSKEVDEDFPERVDACTCPNCRFRISPLPGRSREFLP